MNIFRQLLPLLFFQLYIFSHESSTYEYESYDFSEQVNIDDISRLDKKKSSKKKHKKEHRIEKKPQYVPQVNRLHQEISNGCPEWAVLQINNDLSQFKNKTISRKKLLEVYEKYSDQLRLVKFTISNNKLYINKKFGDDHNILDRIGAFKRAIDKICSVASLPDLVFVMSIHDGLHANDIDTDVPIFLMCKEKHSENYILAPDYESLNERYQVLKDKDITTTSYLWENKFSQLMWRGCAGQHASDESGNIMRRDNLHLFSRVQLCQLSLEYPSMINAKFTVINQGEGDEAVPFLHQYRGQYLEYDYLARFKYQILIDGNVCSYGKSGWRFFSNSVVFLPDSNWTQWYYNDLQPWVHYIPVNENLDDLVDKLQWAMAHDLESKQIAQNGRNFAISHPTAEKDTVYLYYLLCNYAYLNFE